ncbi:MAG: DNA polymerase V [Crocinitomicaceae bacterium]|jgi:DNA polymerase V
MYALVDCNNFYCSCERVFNAKLRNKPIIVLSNNDGCAISRSQEAKDLGIKMGAPYFKIQEICEEKGIFVRSSNYTLYADMSHRIKQVLDLFSSNIEDYSIDESFLDLSDIPSKSLNEHGKDMKDTVYKWTGVPVSVGIAPTKTLAKVANHYAKKNSFTGGVFIINSAKEAEEILKQEAVEDVWGIGKQWSEKLRGKFHVTNAYELSQLDILKAKSFLNKLGIYTIRELNGQDCIKLELESPTAKSLVRSRSFGRGISIKKEMKEAVAEYATRAAEKLRKKKLVARNFSVFMRTPEYRDDLAKKYSHGVFELDVATNNTLEIVSKALEIVDKIWSSGYIYGKAGIIATKLEEEGNVQQNLFIPLSDKNNKLMKALDIINNKFGKDCIKVGAMSKKKNTWHMKRRFHSNKFTTNWNELMNVIS